MPWGCEVSGNPENDPKKVTKLSAMFTKYYYNYITSLTYMLYKQVSKYSRTGINNISRRKKDKKPARRWAKISKNRRDFSQIFFNKKGDLNAKILTRNYCKALLIRYDNSKLSFPCVFCRKNGLISKIWYLDIHKCSKIFILTNPDIQLVSMTNQALLRTCFCKTFSAIPSATFPS